MASAWVFQKSEDVRDRGAKAPYYVGWYDPDGKRHKKSFGPGIKAKTLAERYRSRLEEELTTGVYEQAHRRVRWADFRQQYEELVLPGLAVNTRTQVTTALDHFERIINPARVLSISTQHIDDYIAVRRQERGKKKGELASPATVNKSLRHLKAVLAVAVEWEYLARLPKFRMEKVPRKLPRYVTGDHFAVIYAACIHAKRPKGMAYEPADWWRALIVMGYMTGWRIGDMLGLRRPDLNLEEGTAVTRAEDNKAKRDELVKLHPVVVGHLRKLPGFDDRVFPWNHDRTTLHNDFLAIQKAAGINLPCLGEHEHTEHCHVYGFHDLRRAFATMNADKLTADALQTLMRHKSYQTTQVYINLARQMDQAVASLHVPDVLRQAAT